jgi:hypothetical protein
MFWLSFQCGIQKRKLSLVLAAYINHSSHTISLSQASIYKEGRVLDKEVYKFYNYSNDSYGAYSHSHLMLLSSGGDKIDLDTVMRRWRDIVA